MTPALNGCTCECHYTPGVMHLDDCCPAAPTPVSEQVMRSTSLNPVQSQLPEDANAPEFVHEVSNEVWYVTPDGYFGIHIS